MSWEPYDFDAYAAAYAEDDLEYCSRVVDGHRCDELLNLNGTCHACQTVLCRECDRVVAFLDYDYCEDECRDCRAREEFPKPALEAEINRQWQMLYALASNPPF
jgi:hypothetical protein